MDTNAFTVADSTGNTAIAGTLTVTSATNLNGGLAMDTNAFTVADSTGNTAIAGTLTVSSATALNGGITVDTNAFTVADSTGNTAIAGTLTVTSATDLNGMLTVSSAASLNGGITVDGVAFTVADSTGNTAIGGTLQVASTASFLDVTTFSKGFVTTPYSVSATLMGASIPYGYSFVTVSSINQGLVVALPPSASSTAACTTGHTIKLYSSDAYTLKTSDPSNVSLQGESGSSCTSSVTANLLVECTCVTGSDYVCTTVASDGAVAALAAPGCSRRRSRSLLHELSSEDK